MTETKSAISLNEQSLATWQAKDLEHLRYEYSLKETDLVIDLGAYKGEWANEIWRRYRCRIIAVEPTEYIKGFQHGEVLNRAVSTREGRTSFGGRAYYTSAFENWDHDYPCLDVNRLLISYPDIAVLKINIEGSEYDILNHIIGAGLHRLARNIQVQFHQISGVPYERWYEEIAEKLSKTHHLTWQYKFCWENWALNPSAVVSLDEYQKMKQL